MKLRRINLLFITLIACLTVACIVHTTISYITIANDQMTSAPPQVAFFLIIPYGFSALILAISWLLIVKMLKKHNEFRTK